MKASTMNASLKMLLDIAKEMIMEKGCRATTLQEIADRGGLTKGAIYHYVKSKDELFALILEEGMEEANEKFFESTATAPIGPEGKHGPLSLLSVRLRNIASADSAASQVFIYLLSQKDKPAVAKILGRYYDTSIQTSKKWIEYGQKSGAIPASVNAEKAARMFTVFKNGLQVQHSLGPENEIDDAEIYAFMANVLSEKGTH